MYKRERFASLIIHEKQGKKTLELIPHSYQIFQSIWDFLGVTNLILAYLR